MLAPVVLFAWNRPAHTRKTLESLERNYLSKESELFVFVDGPRGNFSKEQIEKINETKRIIREKQWCGMVHVAEKEKNVGLANSIIAGVTDVINKFGKVIVLEDDLFLSKNFLQYMNEALDRFEKEEKVMQISGYMHPINISLAADCFFLPTINSWGWGTWKRVWDNFDVEANGFATLKKNKELRKRFNLSGAYPFYKMLRSQVENGVDSWAIRFYLSVFMQDGLTLYPKYTLVKNIGMDGSGIHCRVESEQNDVNDFFKIRNYPTKIEISPVAKKKLEIFLKKQMNAIRRVFRFIKQILK
jgi:hypothetical protein